MTALASASVTLTPLTPDAPPVITSVSISGTGFPSGTIPPANVTVTITPSPGNGSAVSTTAIGVTPVTGGSSRVVAFKLPVSLTAAKAYASCVSISGGTSANVLFSSGNCSPLTIDPPASILSISPGAEGVSTTFTATIVGYYTHFLTALPTVTLTGPGGSPLITGTLVNVTDNTHLTAQFVIPANATGGTYLVQTKMGTEVASLPNGFLVSLTAKTHISSILPNTAAAGFCGTVTVVGLATNWANGVTVATLGDGIDISGLATGPVTVTGPTGANFPICIDPIAFPGPRTLTMVTGGQFTLAANAFTVTPNGSSLTTVSPTSGLQGTNATLTLTGNNTHWVQSGTTVSVGGINVGNIVVNSHKSLTVNISIGPGVAVGSYPVTVTTNGEVVSLPNAFSVGLATPFLSGVSPNTGLQGQLNENVTFTGVLTHFLTGSFTANFGPDITVNSINVASDISATANITISSTAFSGGRTASITTNGTIYPFSFTVNVPAGVAITSVTPGSGLQGSSVALQVLANGTHWAPGLTFASLGGSINVNRVQVNGAGNAEVDITISPTAGLGAYSLTMSTNGEIVTATGALTVLPYTPSLTVAPSSGMIGTKLFGVNLNGNFTHFANAMSAGPTLLNIDGQGITLSNFVVNSAHNAQVDMDIALTAPTSPSVLCNNAYGGNRIVTMETPLASGSEIVNAGFCVTSTPAVLTSINPYHSAEPATIANVAITGQYTHFVAGTTTVGFGPEIVVNSVSVGDATHVSANITIPANTPIGWLPVFVNTGTEQLTIGFGIDPPATATLLSVSPSSGVQGQSLQVQIVGNLTNFNTATTEAIFGAGITVNQLIINSTASATAQISIDPLTQAGGRTVTMLTNVGGNEEAVSGPLFGVTQGVATISQVGCGAQGLTNFTDIAVAPNPCNFLNGGIPQGDIVTFAVLGSGTHWLQGETTLAFGAGITVATVTIIDATHAIAQVTVSYSAPIGFSLVTATTNGEVAPSFTDAVRVVASSGLGLNITPTFTPQGTTITMQVNGTATHFTAGNTVATFGNNNGINITNISVISPTQMNLTVQVLGTAYWCCSPYTLTVTTTGLPVPPNLQSTEQLILPNAFSITPGVALITNVTPTGGAQGTTANLIVTGQNTNFLTGVTTAFLSTGGCTPPTSAGVNVSNVTASTHKLAQVAIAVSPTAPTGYQTLCMYTLGEAVSYGNAFTVTPGEPTLNSVTTPTNGSSGQQGQVISNIAIVGQYTHWGPATTATFGQGITMTNLTILTSTTATASIAIDPLAYTGSRNVTLTTGTEIVSGSFFNVIPGPAILSSINPSTANNGAHILMTITGQDTHWSQTLTQFSIAGGGYDIIVNGVVVNTPTSALADLTITAGAALGTRTVFMSTEGENVALAAGFLVTGGIPAITSVSPNYGTRGDVGDNVIISGFITNWTSSSIVDFGDPNIVLTNVSYNSSTSITAVLNILAGATLGVHTVTVTTGGVALTGQYNVLNPAAPPVPYISYEYPSVALVGQTLQVNLYGAYTKWNPGGVPGSVATTATFGAGIVLNNFQVTGLTSAIANITIVGCPGFPVGQESPGCGATVGPRTVSLTTGTEVDTTSFYVAIGTPAISLVDPVSAIQGDTRDLDLVGQYTTWLQGSTHFTFCSGIVLNSTTIFGPNAARVNITVPILQPTGGCGVVATTGTEIAYNYGAGFSITPSTATIISPLLPANTAIQGTQGFVVNVTGLATHWDNTTNFTLGGGVSVGLIVVHTPISATLTLNLAPLASPGFYSLTATTGGEVATLNNAFVVKPGTPLLLSSTPGSFQQQGQFSIGILGQFTNFIAGWPAAGSTNVQLSGLGANITTVNVTGPQSITVLGNVTALAYTGCSNIIVTTGAQVLTLYSAFCITPGPAAITLLNPNTGGTGNTYPNVQITGTNTNWVQGTTVGNFGPGISLNTLTINGPLSATASITIAANANPQANTVTLTTAGESASDPLAFTILAASPVIDISSPNTGVQGAAPFTVSVTSSFTHFDTVNHPTTTTANFGPGIATSVVVTSATTATVTVTISPIAAVTTRNVQMSTPIGGGNFEVATKSNAFSVTAGSATISAINPNSPLTVHQNDTGDTIAVHGTGTHFTSATPTVVFCGGVTTAAVVVNSDIKLTATVNIATFAPTGACGVTVTTGGEVAASGGTFNILAGLPVITQVSPAAGQQGQQNETVNITGLYTRFTSGALTVAIPGGTLAGAVTPINNTLATAVFNFSNTATIGAQNVTVSDTTDGTLTDPGAFTVTAGVPALLSVNPNTQGQGVTQPVVLTGAFTHFSTSSVVTVSGSGVTVGTITSATATSITVPFTVTPGAAAGARTVYVTTLSENVSLGSAFTVQAGVPNITSIAPNIGVPNSTVPVTISGIFTNWTSGTTTVSLGAGITVTPTSINPTSIAANVTIPNGFALGPVNVVVTTTGAGGQVLTVINGFTVQSTTTTPPVPTYVNPTSGAGSVPINTQVSVTFSEPLDPLTISTANAFITDSTVASPWSVSGMPATVSLDVSGRILTIVPSSPLAVGRLFYLQLNSYGVPGGTATIADQSGNALGHYYYSFTTGFTADNAGPTYLTSSIPAGATNVPTNIQTVMLGFDKPINPATQSAGLSIVTAGNPVPGIWSYSSDFTKSIFTPNPALTAGTTYTVAYTAALQGDTGIALVNPGSYNFTTGAGVDAISGAYVTWTPPYPNPNPVTTGTNPTIRFIYNKPINPLSITPADFYVYDTDNGVTVLGSTISYSADLKTFTLSLAGPLQVSTNYRWILSAAYDWAGNYVPYGSVYFTTGTGPDATAPTVTSVSPSSAISCGGSPCAPVNAEVLIQFSELMDPTSLTPGAVTLTPTAPVPGPAVAGTFSFSSNGACTTPSSSASCNFSTLSFTPSSSLAVNTTYQIAIPAGGLTDLSGNLDPFTSSFTTGASPTPDTTHGTITSITPSSQATNVPLNTNIVVQLNKAVDPLTVYDITTRPSYSQNSFVVYDQTANLVVPGTVNISPDLQTLTFTQTLPFQSNHYFCFYGSYWQSFYDLAGNSFTSYSSCFTTGTGTDNIAPTVISVTPLNNATGIGPNNPVMLTFSKSINVGTFSSNVAIYNGSALYLGNNYSYSGDGTTLSFNTSNLPFGTTFTVVVSPNITDLAGNHLATEFSSTFTTAPQPVTAQPSVTSMRPGNGATGVATTTPVTFFMSAPMNPATINAGTLIVSQNGVALNGAISVAASNQDVTFTPPGGVFAAGAYIQVFFTSGATDAAGNPLYNFQSSFRIAPSLAAVAPTILSCAYCYSLDTTGVIEFLFSKPLNPATAIAANFFVKAQDNTTLLPGTVSLLDGGRLLRFTPASPLPASACQAAWVYLTANLQDTTGLSFAGNNSSYYSYVCTSAVSNSAPPSVSATAPTSGATGIGTNAVVSVTFSENVDQNTLDPSTVTLASGGNNIPLSIAYNAGNFTMTVTPQAPLPPSAAIALTLNGVTDSEGDALSPTPYTLNFNTGAAPDYNPPVFVTSNITYNQINVPVTTSISLTFNKPLDFRSAILGNTVVFQDATAGYPQVAATVTPVGSSGLLVTPTAALSVNHYYRVYWSGLADLNGNTSAFGQIYFTTVLVAPPGGPVVTQIIPVNGTNPPPNFSPMVQFDRAVSPTSLAGVTLTQGGNPVAATAQLSSGGTVLTLVPNSILTPGLPYVFTVAGVTDAAGNAIAGPVVRNFTTGPAIELTGPVITLASPIYNSTTGTNPELLITFSEQVNPIDSGSFVFYNVQTGGSVNGSALSWAADFKSVRITYPGTLSPTSRYYFYLNSVCNLANYCVGSSGDYFYTGAAPDTTPESVTTVNPPDQSTGVPLNPAISLVLATPAAPGSVSNSSVTLSPPIAGVTTTVSVSADGYTLTLSLGGNILAASTQYTIGVPGGAFTDQNGNAVSAFSSIFTTGTSTEVSSFHGTISMTNPAPGAAGVAIVSSITLTFSQPLNPNSLNASTFIVYENNNGNYRIAGTVTNPTSTTLVFTPAVALPPATNITVWAGYNANITDYAGNYFSALTGGANAVFTTASTVDNTPPQVISMSPGVNATNVGPYAPVSLTFNKSLDYTTINAANFAIYNGSTLLSPGISYSSDRRTVTFNITLPYNSTIEVAVNTGVQDYAGNHMANSYTASFTTMVAPATGAPHVIQARPGSGAALNNPISFYMSAPMNLPAVQAGMYVAQNGVLIPGTATLTADLRDIVWTPQSSYPASALIEAYLTSTATDTTGNPATPYKLSFTTQAAVTGPPTEISVFPGRYSYAYETGFGYLTNPAIEILFSRPLNPATVTASTFTVTAGSSPGGAAIPGTILPLADNNTLLRFVPTAAFPTGVTTYFYVTLTTGIQDAVGDAFAGDGYYSLIYSGAALDNTPPTVASVTPPAGATGIGDNAPVRLTFNKLVDPLTINPTTVHLKNVSTQLPWTASFTTTGTPAHTVATLLPQSPLPDSATITVALSAGVTDYTGAAITAQSSTFQTMAGADFSAPYVIQQSINGNNNTNVPTNATFTFVFNKPLDPSTVVAGTAGNANGGPYYVYDRGCTPTCYPAVTANVSADGRTVTIVPQANLTASQNYDAVYGAYATDLNGNPQTNFGQSFNTAATANVTGPTIVATNPLSTNPNPVPTNTSIEVIFSAPVSGTSLGSVTLTGGANGPYTTVFDATYTDDTVIRIVPQSLLQANTLYTVNVTGVKDLAGNAAGTTSFTFTTGPDFQTAGLNFVSATVTTGSGTVPLPSQTTIPNVLDNPTIVITLDHEIDYATLLHSGFTFRDVNGTVINNVTVNYALSADQKTITVTTSGLAAATTYHLFVGYYTNYYDISGNTNQGYALLYFTTQ